MPTYEYECDHCGHFDYFQHMSDAPLTVCPTCGGKVRRLIGEGAGIIFKGSGFYVTDNNKTGSESTHSHKKEKPAKTAQKEAPPAPAAKTAEADAKVSA